jgi:threonine synthase
MPEDLPVVGDSASEDTSDIPKLAESVLAPFFAGSALSRQLPAICHEAFNFPIRLTEVATAPHAWSLLELFHGPTAAFKDFGARFLAATMSRIVTSGGAEQEATILVATSGDTGGAVAAAFHGLPGVRVIVLYPDGRVSPRQEHQLTCWGNNVTSLAVSGEFDDCQRLVKEAFADPALVKRYRLCSANSINVGRLLPQSVYYAWASSRIASSGEPAPGFIVPTGNLGNGFACVWARRMGFPIGRLLLATNANKTIGNYLDSGQWQPGSSIATLASAMDVGNPSNMERLQALCGAFSVVTGEVGAMAASDEEIAATIAAEYRDHQLILCPHTAAGVYAYRNLPDQEKSGNGRWVVVATAHAAKFDSIVEPIIGATVEPPPALTEILSWPASHDTIAPELEELRSYL